MSITILIMNLFVAVVLPVSIVWISLYYRNRDNARRAEILLAAVQNGQKVDFALFDKLTDKRKSLKRSLMMRMQGGAVCLFLGLGFLFFCFMNGQGPNWTLMAGVVLAAVGLGLVLTYLVGRRFMAKEIEHEEQMQNAPSAE